LGTFADSVNQTNVFLIWVNFEVPVDL